jgi:hypothetical protein
MKQPKGYVKLETKQLVCHLHKNIYGLRQATRQWNLKFDSFMTKNNLVTSDANLCVYHINVRIEPIAGILWMMELFVFTDESKLMDILHYLRQHFEMAKDLETTMDFMSNVGERLGQPFCIKLVTSNKFSIVLEWQIVIL